MCFWLIESFVQRRWMCVQRRWTKLSKLMNETFKAYERNFLLGLETIINRNNINYYCTSLSFRGNYRWQYGVKLLHDWKYSSKRSEFLRFYCYLCHVYRWIFLFSFCNTKISEFFDMAKFWATFCCSGY